MVRTPFVGGNWKSNGNLSRIKSLVTQLNSFPLPNDVEVVVAPTALHLLHVQQRLKQGYQIAAQNCSSTKQGAFTGEIAADMLKDTGIQWVILGHSERRSMYGDQDQVVGQKVGIALKENLNVIACIGETLQERKSNVTMSVLTRQLEAIAANVSDWSKVVLAYEPVWAIGTGVTATPSQAQEVHQQLRQWLTKKFGASIAGSLRIIYGGSVNAKNCDTLIQNPDIDGFLVGGAALKPEFAKIIGSPSKIKSKL